MFIFLDVYQFRDTHKANNSKHVIIGREKYWIPKVADELKPIRKGNYKS